MRRVQHIYRFFKEVSYQIPNHQWSICFLTWGTKENGAGDRRREWETSTCLANTKTALGGTPVWVKNFVLLFKENWFQTLNDILIQGKQSNKKRVNTTKITFLAETVLSQAMYPHSCSCWVIGLTLNSPFCPETQRSSCLCLPTAEIQGVCHHCWVPFAFLKCWDYSVCHHIQL